ILPQLKAGESLRLKATLTPDAPARADVRADVFAWHDRAGDFTELRCVTRPVLRYHYRAYDDSSKENRDQTYKVFHHLFSPKGKFLTPTGWPKIRAFPSPPNRGIFSAFNRISYGKGKTADLWHCTNGAHLSHDRFLAGDAGPVVGRHRLALSWYGQ